MASRTVHRSSIVTSPSIRSVRRSIADQFAPVAALHVSMVEGWELSLDFERVQRRLGAAQTAFDALAVVAMTEGLESAFDRVVTTLEDAGLCRPDAKVAFRRNPPDLMALASSWIAGEAVPASGPRRVARQAMAIAGNTILARAAADVRARFQLDYVGRGVCPCCGGAAEFSIPGSESRRLICMRCDTMWRVSRSGCLTCGADGRPSIAYVRAPVLGYALAICNACGRYVKERTIRNAESLVIERAVTAQLDAAAEERGLRI
jgi:hypothetical protein